MTNLAKAFESLPLKQAEIVELQIVPLRKLAITFHAYLAMMKGLPSGLVYDLQFNKITDFKIDMNKNRCCVDSHKAFTRSAYLAKFKKRNFVSPLKIRKDKLRHFRFILDAGQLDVIAEDFSWNMITEV